MTGNETAPVAPLAPPFARAVEAFALQRFDNPAIADAPPDNPFVSRLAQGFALSKGEVALVKFLFAAAWSERIARLVASQSPASGGRGVPIWLLLRLLPELEAGSLAPERPLCRFGMVEVEGGTLRIEAQAALSAALTDRLAGSITLPVELASRMRAIAPDETLADPALTADLVSHLAARGRDGLSPVVATGRTDPAILSSSLAAAGLRLHAMGIEAIPEEPEARDRIARHWSREAAMGGSALLLLRDPDAPLAERASDFAERVAGHVLIAGNPPQDLVGRQVRVLSEPCREASAGRWKSALGSTRIKKLGPELARVISQFQLRAPEIDAVCALVAPAIDAARSRAAAGQILWHAAARAVEPAPGPGVTIVEPSFSWDDIVVAPSIHAALIRVEAHVRHATLVFDQWGFAERLGGRGRGVAALFSGPSGTGKTMAAEVLAHALDLRMMRIDLSQIINKYIGETSKNIAAAFEQAERCGAVMVWNEGDAIWGTRGTVGNATDRHVNAEVGDLLQRIEMFRGFTIVTTNMKQAIDPAFLRRFRFAIDFPMPARTERLRIWKNAFPKKAPLQPMDMEALAALPLSGGSICNIALGSAFLAADRGEPIGKEALSAEIGEEMRKHNQPVPQIEWSNGA